MPQESNASGLTPVRIRGKKRHHVTQQKSKLPIAGPRRPASSKEGTSTRASKTYVGRLSALELLPKEILELVFTFTVNPNLPRASPVIARKLSGQTILDWHCRRIFRTFEYELRTNNPQRYVVTDGRVGENWHDLIKARTCTLQHSRITCDYFISLLDKVLDEEKDRLLRQYEASNRQTQVTWTEHGDLRIGHINPLLDVKAQSQLDRVIGTLKISLDFTCNIPGTLLRYPLSSDSRRLLDFLVEAGAQVDWQNSFDGEKAHKAWNRAVRAKDYRLVHRLMGPGEFCAASSPRSKFHPSLTIPGINVRPSEEELHDCLEALEWDAPMLKLIAISFNMSKAYYSSTTVPRRLPWPIEGYGNYEELGVIGVKACFESKYPTVWMKSLAGNRPGTLGRELLDDFSNKSLVPIWGGAMCSASTLKDSQLCYCLDPNGRAPLPGAWHVLEGFVQAGEDVAMTC